MRYKQLHPNGRSGLSYMLEDRLSLERKMLFLIGAQDDLTALEKQIDRRTILDHPHLMSVDDISWRGRRLGLVTKQLLSLRSEKPSMMQRLTLALRYAEALAASHRRGLLAGWISPQDFFLDERKSPILGLALDRSLESNPRDRNVLRYIAPEVLASKRGSPAGDIYSLGLSLYLLFTCRVPFENSPDHLLHLKRTATLPIGTNRT